MVGVVGPRTQGAEVGKDIPDRLRAGRDPAAAADVGHLVIQASILGEGGELFVLDMGEPYKIINIARRMIELSGFNVEDIPIELIGKRPGEKLSEELFYDFEKPESSKHERIFNCNFKSIEDLNEFQDKVNELVNNHSKITNSELKDLIIKLAL